MQTGLIVAGVLGLAFMLEAIRRMVSTDTEHPGMWSLVFVIGYTTGTLCLAAASSSGAA